MKRISVYLSVILFTGIIFLGCQKEANITEPSGARLMSVGTVDCPEPGSGAAGVAAFECTGCTENPATTCNGEFSVEFKGRTVVGNSITFEYEVCEVSAPHNLSHWILGLNLDCLGDGFGLSDLITSVKKNNVSLDLTQYKLGLDPTTQLTGLKFDLGAEGCNTYSVTFDKSKLAEGYTLGEGCGLAATKAGNQDITRADRATPGYVCVTVPECVQDEEPCYEYYCETGFGGNTGGGGKSWFFIFDKSVTTPQTIWAGKTMNAGTVKYENGNIIIQLAEGWSLQTTKRGTGCVELLDEFGNPIPYNEAVKIQGYNTQPSSRPAAGLFTTYKGNNLTIPVTSSSYYVIHLDLVRQVEVPCE